MKAQVVEKVQAAPASDSTHFFAMIERAAKDATVDLDKMERLYVMYEKVRERDARDAYYRALAECKADMPVIVKNRANTHTRSRYADLAAIAKAADPVIAKHGFAITFGTFVPEREGYYGLRATVVHVAGHSEEIRAEVPADLFGMKGEQNKTSTHAFGSTMSYGRRYLKCLAFDLVPDDDDDGNAAGSAVDQPINAEQFATLNKRLDETKGDKEAFCRRYRIDALNELPQSKFALAMAEIKIKELTPKKKEKTNESDD